MNLVKIADICTLAEFPPYDILYCDPPWGDGLVKMFETMMAKEGHPKPGNTIDGILSKLFSLAKRDKSLYVEWGEKGYDIVIQSAKLHRHTHSGTVRSTQKNGNALILMCFNTDYIPQPKQGFHLVSDVAEYHLRSISQKTLQVFDPFAGIGATAKAVRSVGAHYIGYELNPARAARCQKVIDKMQ